jgi:hypothetical protein
MTTINLSDLLPASEPGFEQKLQAVLNLADNGRYVFPTCGIKDKKGTCGSSRETLKDAGKHPIDGAGIKTATRNKVVLSTYFNSNPTANVAIYCRKSGLLVVDIDPRNGGDTSWAHFVKTYALEIPETVEVITGEYEINGNHVRGTHLYFSVSGDLEFIGSLKKFNLPGVEFKYNGYVIAPPSKHFSGVEYEFKEGSAPWQIEAVKLPPALEVLLQADGRTYSGEQATYEEGAMTYLTTCSAETTTYGAAALTGICSEMANAPEGQRNATLFKQGIRAASLVAGGEIAFDDMNDNLQDAARSSGLDQREIEQVLLRPQGAFEIGASQPSSAPKVEEHLAEWARSHAVVPVTELSEQHIDFLERINVVDLHDIFREHEPELWYVPGFICSGRGHALLSESGVGKSLLMREVCAKLALGESVWDNPAQEPIRILYLDYENDPVFDIGASMKSMRLDTPDAYEGRLTFLSYPEIGYFDTPAGAADMERALDLFAPDLVVIDTLSRVVEGEENSNDTWLKFYKSVGLVFKRRGQAYVRIDHLGKNTDKGARGGSAKSGDIDLIWTIYKRKGENNYFDIVNSKSRAYLEKKRITIERKVEPLTHAFVATPEVDWDQLLKDYAKYENLMAWFAELDSEGKFVGQKALWREHMEELQEMGVALHYFNATHKEYKENKSPASAASK